MLIETNYIKRKLLFVVFFFALLNLPITVFASHNQGANITYQCLGGNQYRITMSLYRRCGASNPPNTLIVNIRSASCGINYNSPLLRIGPGIEISQICPSMTTMCTGGTLPGVQEFIYSGIITLISPPPGNGNCTDWIFSCNLPNNRSTSNTISPTGVPLYIESRLNNVIVPCNSSPTFTNRPVPFICQGQSYCYNNVAVDPDGDSLVYSLITPMTSSTTVVNYIVPYSATQPLASSPAVSFNTVTGEMCMTPTLIQATFFAILVQEYRNGVFIGSIVRDIQLRTVTCTNNNPFLTGINGTGSFTLNACAGVPLSFTIPSNDANAPDQLTLTWNSGIVGGVFTVGPGLRPTGTFSWTPPLSSIGTSPNCFTVTVRDNACPFNGSQTYSFCINVRGVSTTSSSVSARCASPNGSATVVPSGGISPYTYSWTPSGGTGATTVGVDSGTYTCLVTDFNGCTKSQQVTVGYIPPGTASIGTFNDVSCFGVSDGSITVSMSGAGVVPFAYAWTPNVGTTATVSGLGPATYTCVVTDAVGCTSSVTKVITQPVAALTVNAPFTNVGCFGGTTGTVTATVPPSAGTPPYTYLWLPGAFTASSISSLSIGTYTLTVTDAKGCTATATVNIQQPPALAISSTTAGATCGSSNGSATVTGSGGFAPYTWAWSGGQTTAAINGLAVGTYTVTISDLNLCTASFPVSVSNIAGPTASILSSTNVSCFGANNGNATISVSGGTLPFTYLWNNGQTTPTAVNLAAGIYSVLATDANGCAATANITITQPGVLIANVIGVNPACFGNTNGSVLVSALGGTQPYTYSWSTGSTQSQISNLTSQIYSVTVTDFKGCSDISSDTLLNPAQVITSISNTSVLCAGACNGTATATASNGYPPYTYLWNNSTAQTIPTATGLCAGTYSVAVLDANGCPSQALTTIGSPTPLTNTIASTGNVTCFGLCNGFAQITALGGTSPYSYNWMPGAITTATATSLCAGTYTCTVADLNGCTTSSTVSISEPAQLFAPVTGVDLACNGLCTGVGVINFSGGVAPYSFLWMPGLQNIYNPANLCMGINSATLTDANGCTATNSVTLNQPAPLVITTSVTNANCGQADGGACVTVSGGGTPYSYLWSDTLETMTSCISNVRANTYNVTVTDGNDCTLISTVNINDASSAIITFTTPSPVTCFGGTNGTATATVTGGGAPYSLLWTPSGQTVLNPPNLAAGVNTLTVTDATGCIASASVTINEPPEIVSVISILTNVTCFGVCDGTSNVLYSGGVAPLTHVWNDPASQTTATASNLCAGIYEALITDAQGCTLRDTATIIAQPNALTIQSSVLTHITCKGDADGSISTVAVGGSPFYTFTWVPSVSAAAVANNLSPGPYTLNLTDINGCIATQTWTVTEPPALSNTYSIVSSTCGLSNGSATVTASGGTPAYTYQWNDFNLQTTALASGLTAGIYICVITDNHLCFLADTIVVIDIPGPMIDSVVSTPVLCFGDSTGTARVYPTTGMGTTPFSYLWSPGSQTDSIANGLPQGSYTAFITDANGCTTNGSVLVSQPSPVSIIVSPTDTICYGDTAQIYGQGVGGSPGYLYTWIGPSGLGLLGSGPHLVMPTATTIYTVSLLDVNGCAVIPMDITVVVRPPLSIIATDVVLCNGESGIISGAVSGGNGGPYTYLWSNGLTTLTQTITASIATSPTNYIITVDDGCSTPSTDTATVTVNPSSIGVINESDTLGCQPLTVNFNAVSDNGTSYIWNFGNGNVGTGSSVNYTYPLPGIYLVTMNVITLDGCTTLIANTNNITVNPLPNADFSVTPNPTSILSPTIELTDLSTVTILSWSWNFDDASSLHNTSTVQNPTHLFNNLGFYNVSLIVMNQFGCFDTAVYAVEVKDDFVFYAPNTFTPDDDDLNDTFLPKGVGFDIHSFNLFIFNRWGNLIFYSNDPAKGWDGRANHGSDIAQQDVYVWKVDLKDNLGIIHKYIGHVTIVK